MTSPTKTIIIKPCLDTDIPQFFRTMSAGFEHDAPFVDIYFPAHDTEAGQLSGSARLLAWKRDSPPPETTFLKAILHHDEGQSEEEIIGVAIWTLMKTAPPRTLEEAGEDVHGTWPDARDAEYMAQLWGKYIVDRSEAVARSGGKGVYVLELLSVDKNFHRQGAGTALVQWGTRKADEEGLEAVVEATPIGLRTYQKAGFEIEVERMDMEVDDKFADRKKPELTFLRRAARKV